MLVFALLILFGLLCFTGIIISFIFTFIGFANNSPRKFYWLSAFFLSIIGLVVAYSVFVREAFNTIDSQSTITFEQFQILGDEVNAYEDMLESHKQTTLHTNQHIKLLQSYQPNNTNVSDDFYAYLGFETYLRLPLRYPYAIHCVGFYDNGELFNEQQVNRFDENDNGEVDLHITSITKLAFDKNYLLLEQQSDSKKQYILFTFETETTENVATAQQLFKLAKSKGYTGSHQLIRLEEYSQLFKSNS